jgi:hypothetical protein
MMVVATPHVGDLDPSDFSKYDILISDAYFYYLFIFNYTSSLQQFDPTIQSFFNVKYCVCDNVKIEGECLVFLAVNE